MSLLVAIAGPISAPIARKIPFMDFWSLGTNKIIIPVVAADIVFPNIVVAGLPAGLTIQKVIMLLIFRAINNTNAVANSLTGASKTIRIKISIGAWGAADIIAITFATLQLFTAAAIKEGGTAIIGSSELSSVVTGNATYNVRADQTTRGDAIVAALAALELYDVQVGLRVWFN